MNWSYFGTKKAVRKHKNGVIADSEIYAMLDAASAAPTLTSSMF